MLLIFIIKIIKNNYNFFFIFILYMRLFDNYNDLEVGIDECARGVMFGRVYAAAVIWPNLNIKMTLL